MGNAGHILAFILLFVLCLWATLLVCRVLSLRSEKTTDEPTQEAQGLRERADANLKAAEDMAKRAKRLEYLVDLRKRGKQ